MSSPSVNLALSAFNAGKLDESRRLLQSHLKSSPGDVDALYMLGVTEQASNRPEIALALYDQALVRMPEHLGAHYNKGLLLLTLGRHAEAMPHHDAATRLAPGNPWAFVNRGNSRAALRQHKAALADFDRALQLQPDLAEVWANKGNALNALSEHEHALRCIDRALELTPQNATAWANRSAVLTKMRRYEDALQAADQALHFHGTHPQGWICKAIALNQLDKHEEALSCIDKAIQFSPRNYDAWLARGDILADLGRFEEGFVSYGKCLDIDPGHPLALINQGVVLSDLGRKLEARACFEKAVEISPEDPDANWSLSLLDLEDGHFLQAWPRYEYRERITTSENKRLSTQRPRWTGQPSDRALLLWGEQGIGDQILYSSILPNVADLPQKKYVALDKRLIPLFARSMPGFEFIDLTRVSDDLDFVEQLPLGSLPRFFRPSLSSFTAASYPFLFADPQRAEILRGKIARAGKLVCGVSWSSNRKVIGKHKSISLEQMLLPLVSDRLHFVNLQYGDTTEEREAVQAAHGTFVQNIDEIDNFNDIDGLAALIQACDLIITTSNSTAHLAGAMGKDSLLLLPLGRSKLWYWTEFDGRNPWYPSVHSFTQTVRGQWQLPLTLLKKHLEGKTWN